MSVHARSRVDRGAAILEAALEVVGQEGFADGAVDEIARIAGVAKPTVYSWFGDKQNLFVQAVNHGVERAGARVLEAIDSIDLAPTDLRHALEQLARELVGCVTSAEVSTVVRLQQVERSRFPAIIDSDVNRRRNTDALAGKLAQLSASGRLRMTDPQRAAKQFMALVSGDVLTRSDFGARKLSPAEVDATIRDGVDTFLAAFGNDDEDAGRGA